MHRRRPRPLAPVAAPTRTRSATGNHGTHALLAHVGQITHGALVALALVAAGCAASLPHGHWDASARRVCAGHVCYVVGALDGDWRLVHQESAATGWFSARDGAIIESNATCRDDAESSPLAALTRELLVGYTERNIADQTLVPLVAREALRTRLTAKLDGVPVQLELYVVRRNGCVFDLSYAAPPRTFTDGARDFTRFVSGFADARPDLAPVVAAAGAI